MSNSSIWPIDRTQSGAPLLHRYVYVLYLYLRVVHLLNYAWKWILTWPSGRENYMHIGVFHDVQVVSSVPCVVIGFQLRSGYASVHICWPAQRHFCLLADANWATEPVSIVYYFLLGVRAVAFSRMDLAMKGYSTFPQSPRLEPRHQMV